MAKQGVWYSQSGLGGSSPVSLVAAPGANYVVQVMKAIIMVDTASAGDKVSLNDSASFVYAKVGAGTEQVVEINTTENNGGSANCCAANKLLQATFTGTTARYTIKVLVDIIPA